MDGKAVFKSNLFDFICIGPEVVHPRNLASSFCQFHHMSSIATHKVKDLTSWQKATHFHNKITFRFGKSLGVEVLPDFLITPTEKLVIDVLCKKGHMVG